MSEFNLKWYTWNITFISYFVTTNTKKDYLIKNQCRICVINALMNVKLAKSIRFLYFLSMANSGTPSGPNLGTIHSYKFLYHLKKNKTMPTCNLYLLLQIHYSYLHEIISVMSTFTKFLIIPFSPPGFPLPSFTRKMQGPFVQQVRC